MTTHEIVTSPGEFTRLEAIGTGFGSARWLASP